MPTGIHREPKGRRPAPGLALHHYAAAAAALLMLSACGSFWDPGFWDFDFASEDETAPAPPPPAHTLKMCCAGKSCATVDDRIVSCNPGETAKTCDENGEYCANHGGPDFRDR